MGRKQSKQQISALVLLLLSALIMERVIKVDWLLGLLNFTNNSGGEIPDTRGSYAELSTRHWTHGVLPILAASFISGLAGALSQKSLQAAGGGRNPFLFSMEICAVSSMMLVAGMIISSDREQIQKQGFWKDWKVSTFIPIVTNSAGGIVVGLVTKYAGSVRKGFALIFGILLSGLIQSITQPEEQISKEQIVGGALAAVSLYIHAAYPPVLPKTVKQE
jgi:UDP-sugar transporter A1/2/3